MLREMVNGCGGDVAGWTRSLWSFPTCMNLQFHCYVRRALGLVVTLVKGRIIRMVCKNGDEQVKSKNV